jgi:XTP/dITP diphosphohydrolase
VGRIVLATRNKGKIAELGAMLALHGVEVVGLEAFPEVGEVVEDGDTFEENARKKARAVAEATGLVAVADDSGLEVDALGGAPGVHSARYAGPGATDAANNAKLLAALAGVPEADRTCRFRCVMLARTPQGRELSAHGAWEGRVAGAPAGEGGFGYDPLFIDLASGRRAAEMAREEKNAVSHRGRALRALLADWGGFLAGAGLE